MITDRDIDVEREFLNSISHLDYALLQRDWESPSHGDLDLAITSTHWPLFIETLLDFTEKRSLPIVKVYEIEYAVICFIILTDKGTLHLDVAITPYITTLFTVDLLIAIKNRETIDNIHMITQKHTDLYCTEKKRWKNSPARRIIKKIRNSLIILRRLKNNVITIRGAILYIPYINDVQILRSTSIHEHCIGQIKNYMLSRYKPR